MSLWAMFGIAAGALSLVDPLPYVRDVLRGNTRPHRGTWGIWTVLGVTAFATQLAGGAGWSLFMLAVQASTVTVVFMLSVRRGVGGLGRGDLVLIGVAVAGVAGWLVSSRPMVAVVCVIVADLAAVLSMIPKTWRDPHSETASTFVLSAASGALATAAVGVPEPGLVLYPAYFAVVNAATAAVILVRLRATERADHD